MKFDFFTLGGRFFWEDVFNYQGWIIQKHIKKGRYRLLDSHHIRRQSGSFELCKDTLLKYIQAYELREKKNGIVIILHGFFRTRASVAQLQNFLMRNNIETIAINYCSLSKNLNYHANILMQFISNLDKKNFVNFINIGAGCLLLRKMIDLSDNYRKYKIQRVLDINPINSGSELADLLIKNSTLKKIFGPMLYDITTEQALEIPQLPQDIEHGIIFCPSSVTKLIKKLLKSQESFPPLSPPSEKSYAEHVEQVENTSLFPLENAVLHQLCLQYMNCGNFEKKGKL